MFTSYRNDLVGSESEKIERRRNIFQKKTIMPKLLGLFSIILLSGLCTSLVHELRLYTGPNQTGDVFTVTAKIPDLAPYRNVTDAVQSFCATGL
jgi:hypothetical protein